MNIRLHDGQITDMYLSDLSLCRGIVVVLYVLQRCYDFSQFYLTTCT